MGCTSSTTKRADAKSQQLATAVDVASKTESKQSEGKAIDLPKVEGSVTEVEATEAKQETMTAVVPADVVATKAETATNVGSKPEEKAEVHIATAEEANIVEVKVHEQQPDAAADAKIVKSDCVESKDSSPCTTAAGTEALPMIVIEDAKTTVCCNVF
jgi:hypothetical protein